ncbi:16S rRNA (uracil(1498)-N(3))-methyltransferase [Aphanothece hegewaldii CCALA 016]|uniref:Ribosomal RNA small subunit methyltransferase E n=1 Tax=Aphanothece hegewaldii CCALA 016 TaxID=2107694 RepID=A0A2T1LXC2_9CHRO|nr:16S rRNA (uracil(1498)-N(3))-methyltransferase [Aphanothece hegewaldii]PSF36818.1 16S rRNA (uracil(1498)-N(3))-methyltransferase [Aphanothece hegewaldii CCALA 016]
MVYRLIIDPIQNQNGQIILTVEQQHYLKRVLRLKTGSCFVIMDGQGSAWNAELQENTAILRDLLKETTELPIAITLMVAIPKGNGFDEIVRCCTEMGVTQIVPIISQRTLVQPSSHKLERWRKIAKEAAEQSERQNTPVISDVTLFKDALTMIADPKISGYICVTRIQSEHLMQALKKTSSQSIMLLTGPEGGWTTEEVEQAINQGFQAVSLGSRILRAVTAPLVAMTIVAAITESQ